MKTISLVLSIGFAAGLISVSHAEDVIQTSAEKSKAIKKMNAEAAQVNKGQQGSLQPAIGQPKPMPSVDATQRVPLDPSVTPVKPIAPPTSAANPKLILTPTPTLAPAPIVTTKPAITTMPVMVVPKPIAPPVMISPVLPPVTVAPVVPPVAVVAPPVFTPPPVAITPVRPPIVVLPPVTLPPVSTKPVVSSPVVNCKTLKTC